MIYNSLEEASKHLKPGDECTLYKQIHGTHNIGEVIEFDHHRRKLLLKTFHGQESFSYDFGWLVAVKDSVPYRELEQTKVGDILIDGEGRKNKVLAISGELLALSENNTFESFGGWYIIDELRREHGCRILQPEAVVKMTLNELNDERTKEGKPKVQIVQAQRTSGTCTIW